ncbi:hypothetical protein [Kribbella sindirgiensis]|nr:hypothetical protein [Kribbella sindirgiensis]
MLDPIRHVVLLEELDAGGQLVETPGGVAVPSTQGKSAGRRGW